MTLAGESALVARCVALCVVLMAALLPGQAEAKARSSAKPRTAADCPGARAQVSMANLPAASRATTCLLNLERARRGRGYLSASSSLAGAAKFHSKEMVRDVYFDHRDAQGRGVADRSRRAGYPMRFRWHIGENLAWGTRTMATPASVVERWMESPGHRANVLDPGFRVVGVGVEPGVPVEGAQGDGATFTAVFGSVRA